MDLKINQQKLTSLKKIDFFFLKEQNFKDMWDKTQKVTHVYYRIPGSGGE